MTSDPEAVRRAWAMLENYRLVEIPMPRTPIPRAFNRGAERPPAPLFLELYDDVSGVGIRLVNEHGEVCGEVGYFTAKGLSLMELTHEQSDRSGLALDAHDHVRVLTQAAP